MIPLVDFRLRNGRIEIYEHELAKGCVDDFSRFGIPTRHSHVRLGENPVRFFWSLPDAFAQSTSVGVIDINPKESPMEKDSETKKRVDENGFAYAGSQLQTQIYVNEEAAALDTAIKKEIPGLTGTEIKWASPLAKDKFKEFKDGDFLAALNLGSLDGALKKFWPKRGPVWDALARFTASSGAGALLIEGKSYPAEAKSDGSGAESPDSRKQIQDAIRSTFPAAGNFDNKTIWYGDFYQAANRIAHLKFLRDQKVDAWLVYLCFENDSTHNDPTKKTDKATWKREFDQMLGALKVPPELTARIKLVILPGKERTAYEAKLAHRSQ